MSEDREVERRINDPWRAMVTARIEALEHRIAENTTLTEAVKENTDEIVKFFQNGKGFFRVVRGVGTVAKWITTVSAGVLILWALAKLGVSQALEDIRK